MEKYLELVLSTLHEMGEDEDNEALVEAHIKTKLFLLSKIQVSLSTMFLTCSPIPQDLGYMLAILLDILLQIFMRGIRS